MTIFIVTLEINADALSFIAQLTKICPNNATFEVVQLLSFI